MNQIYIQYMKEQSKRHIKGTTFYEGRYMTKMVFIVSKKMENIREDENIVRLYEDLRAMYAANNFSNGLCFS
ncbi:hypothetical protein HanXRQr2_Chr04g0181681 [Helianthus annuus]|uniref:Uncharacterized protein n=1 Tax=Helianthus annuus TaxID=4232 RepID=A0A9K3JBI3_HELAN|nr:hypothetical protein HanXRQr2_Chr04g0181681 [Helianthus annuus]